MTLPVGRDRRRKDLIGRIRRLLYGAMLLFTAGARAEQGSTPVSAADGQASKSGNTPSLQVYWSQANSGLVEGWQLEAPPPGGSLIQRPSAHAPVRLVGGVPQPELQRLLSIAVYDRLFSLRDGVGLDFALPDVGNLHLDLHGKRNSSLGGKRWSLNDVEEGRSARSQNPIWSLGGNIDLIKLRDMSSNHSSRRLDVAPQLMLDISRMGHVDGQMNASVQYGYWRTAGNYATSDERVVQMNLRWNF